MVIVFSFMMHHIFDHFRDVRFGELCLFFGVVNKGNDRCQLFTIQLDHAAKLVALQLDHRLCTAPHAGGKFERVHRVVHELGIQHWRVGPTNPVDRMTHDATFFGEQPAAFRGIHFRHRQPGSDHLHVSVVAIGQ